MQINTQTHRRTAHTAHEIMTKNKVQKMKERKNKRTNTESSLSLCVHSLYRVTARKNK